MEFIGVGSLLIVMLVGLFSGMVTTLQTVNALKVVRQEAYVGSAVGLGMAVELAPVFTAIMLAARAGAGIATELGSMRITEQIDAMATMAVNPVQYLFRWPEYSEGILQVAHALPYSDLTSLTAQERSTRFHPEDPIEFGHTLEQTLGGLMSSGFSLDGLLEDRAEDDPLAPYMASYYAVGALRR
jgi:hypothetical protein